MVKDRLMQPDSQEKGWLLDGYPRSMSQAVALKDLGIQPDLFLLLEVRFLFSFNLHFPIHLRQTHLMFQSHHYFLEEEFHGDKPMVTRFGHVCLVCYHYFSPLFLFFCISPATN